MLPVKGSSYTKNEYNLFMGSEVWNIFSKKATFLEKIGDFFGGGAGDMIIF